MQIEDFLNESFSIEDAKFIYNCKEELFEARKYLLLKTFL